MANDNEKTRSIGRFSRCYRRDKRAAAVAVPAAALGCSRPGRRSHWPRFLSPTRAGRGRLSDKKKKKMIRAANRRRPRIKKRQKKGIRHTRKYPSFPSFFLQFATRNPFRTLVELLFFGRQLLPPTAAGLERYRGFARARARARPRRTPTGDRAAATIRDYHCRAARAVPRSVTARAFRPRQFTRSNRSARTAVAVWPSALASCTVSRSTAGTSPSAAAAESPPCCAGRST